MRKLSGYWYRPINENWRFEVQERETDFDGLRDPWLPMDGIVAFPFVTHGIVSHRKIRRLYRKTRRFFGWRPWYLRLWDLVRSIRFRFKRKI